MQIDVGFDIRNRGKGVAVFDHVSIRMILIEEPLSFRRPYKFIKAGFAQQFMRARIIGSAESASCNSTGLRLSKDQWDRVKAMRLGIIVRVTVFFEDVFKRKFWSKFTFEFNPPTPASEYLGVSIPALGGFLMSSPRPRQTRFK
jgi:hypothetical protein